MVWLIVGGNGQLGTSLAHVLKQCGIDFKTSVSADLDIRSLAGTSSLIKTLEPSVIINAAAWTDVDAAESDTCGARSVNVEGTYNLVLAAKEVDAIFVQVSTDYVFSGVGSLPWNEDDVRNPVSVYGLTKAEGEDKVLLNYPKRSYVFRTAWLYSQQGKNFAKIMTKIALKDKGEVRVVNNQIGQPTFALDLASKIVEAVKSEVQFGIYHATNSGQASWFEFAQEIFKLSGADVSRISPISASQFIRPAMRPAYSVLGHKAWESTNVSSMRDWRVALSEAMPTIIRAVMESE
jgi:dTDP-4-dehydrorhamnose reductase